jgi:hypothetical protein
MSKRIAAILIAATLALFALSGCGKPSYGSEEDYRAARANDFNVEAGSATEAAAPSGERFFVWPLRSEEAWADEMEGDGFGIRRSLPFGSVDEANAFIAKMGAETTDPAIPPATFMTERATELGANSGSYLANGDGGAYILWTMPDGTFVRDFVTADGNTFVVGESSPFATRDEAEAGIERIPTFEAYIAKRSQELGAAPVWGTNTRTWKTYAFADSDGNVTVDMLSADADPKIGAVRRTSQSYEDLSAAVASISSQFEDETAVWLGASQYSRYGWALILFVLTIAGLILFNIQAARGGKGGTIRRIAGLDQIDEAVGRATEIARPVLMVPGLGVLSGITVQALTIFAYVIRSAARFGTPIRLLNADASVYAVAQEITRDVYMSEGVPEAYDPTSVRFVSDRQFAFAAGVAGTIQREKVAATFFMGDFYAESMIFAENANMVGAIQVAATTQFTQTPFFIAACDYVLLGDEFYAASAYLGRQPILVGSLIGVDKSKMLIMAAVVVMSIVHSIQMTQKVDPATLPPETAEQWANSGQQYLDWRKDDLFFKRLPKIERP